jgi:hypothetical protein
MMPVPTHNPQRLSGAVNIRARVNGAVAIIRDANAAARRRDRSVTAAVDVQKIEEEIRAYVKNPTTTINRRFFLSPEPPPGPAQKRLAKRLVRQLQELSNLLDDADLPEWLDLRDTGRWAKAIAEDHLGSNWAPDECSVQIEHWIREANLIAKWKSNKKGKAQERSGAMAKLAAAERAVRLFKHHGLKLYRSHSTDNRLNQLAAAIHGTHLFETDEGFFQHCCTVIAALENRPE